MKLPRCCLPESACRFQTGRAFVVLIAGVAYVIALEAPAGIFNLAVQYAFSGFSSLFLLLVGALFWRRSAKWDALAVTVWTAASMVAVAIFQAVEPATPPGTVLSMWVVGGVDIITRNPGGTDVLGFMPVVPMTLISAALMVVVSACTPKPSRATVSRHFDFQDHMHRCR